MTSIVPVSCAFPQQPSVSAVFDGENSYLSLHNGTPRLFLLHHLKHQFNSPALLETAGAKLDHVLSLGVSRPYLFDALLALSASHLRHCRQSSIPACSALVSCRVAEHYQLDLAIRKFKVALEGPMDQMHSDAMILTSMLLNILSFAKFDEYDITESWVFSDRADKLDWFLVGLGLKPLLLSTTSFREDSILCWIFENSNDSEKTYHPEKSLPLDQVPTSWLELCGLSNSSDPDHIFHEPIRVLANLRYVEPSAETILFYTGFFGTLDMRFYRMLQKKYEPAIWIMGYWLGLLCRFDDIWWLRRGARRDYTALCAWLNRQGVRQRSGVEGEMWQELMTDLECVTQSR